MFSELFKSEFSQINTYINFDCVSKVAIEAVKIWNPYNNYEKSWRYSASALDYAVFKFYSSGNHYLSPTLKGESEVRGIELIDFFESELFSFYNKFNDPRVIFSYFTDYDKVKNFESFLWLLLVLRKLYNHPQYDETWDLIEERYRVRNYQPESEEMRLFNIYWNLMKEVKPIYDWKDEYLDPNTIYPGTIIM